MKIILKIIYTWHQIISSWNEQNFIRDKVQNTKKLIHFDLNSLKIYAWKLIFCLDSFSTHGNIWIFSYFYNFSCEYSLACSVAFTNKVIKMFLFPLFMSFQNVYIRKYWGTFYWGINANRVVKVFVLNVGNSRY